MRSERGAQRERGMSTAVEAALLIPVILLVAGVMTAGFRLWHARAELQQTTAAAARAASAARSPAEGSRRAEAVMRSASSCSAPAVSADVTALALPAGSPGEVTLSASCRIRLADLLVPGLPGSMTVRAHSSSPVDTYRERGR